MARQRVTILVAVFILGAYAMFAQAVLLRETQVILFGSELSWGLVLACWLVGVAGGSQAAGRLLRTSGRPWLTFAAAGLAMAPMLALEIAFLRMARSLVGVGPGEYIGPEAMLWITLVAAVPIAVCVGLAFPAASAMAAGADGRSTGQARAVGWTYLVEAAGSLLGGVLYSFVFAERGRAISVALWGGIILALAIGVLVRQYAGSRWSIFVHALFVLVPASIAIGEAGRIDEATVERRWDTFATGLKLVRSEDSRYQNLALGQLGEQFSLYTSGIVAATWPNHQDLAVEAHLAACESPSPRRVLVLGSGAEGLLKELLRYRSARLDYVTLDPAATAIERDYLAEEDRQALAALGDGVHFGDVRRFVMQAAAARAERYDLIILAAPEPASALEARLYTADFFAELAKILCDDGVITFSLHGSVGYWSPEQAEYVGSIVLALEGVFPDVLLTFGDPTRCFAARRKGVLTDDGAELARRYRAAGVTSPYFDPLWFAGASDLLDPVKRATVTQALRRYRPAFLNTDERPAAALYHMRLWLRTAQAGHEADAAPAAKRFDWLGALMRLRFDWVILAVLVATGLAAAVGVVRGREAFRRTALFWSIGTTGFAMMALEIILLYTFQTMYGYVYSMVGTIVGLFMFGLVLGSLWMNRRLRRYDAASSTPPPGLQTLAGLDLAMVVFSAVLVLVLAVLRGCAADWPVQVATFALVAVAGILGGLVFPLAASVALEGRSNTLAAAGGLYAADNLGACAGALVTGLMLVPILGVSGACLAVVGMKALSAVLVGAAATLRQQVAAGPSSGA